MSSILTSIMEQYLIKKEVPYYIAMVIPKITEDEIEKLTRRAHIKKMYLALTKQSRGYYRFEAKLVKRKAYGHIVVGKKIWFLIGKSDSIDTFVKVVRNLYPLLVLPMIPVWSFINIIDYYTSKYYEAIVVQFLLRKRGTFSDKETTKKWLQKSYDKAIIEIKQLIKKEQASLDSIKLLIKSEYLNEYFELGITRKGFLTIYSGAPHYITELILFVIEPFLEKVYEERTRFTKIRRYIDSSTGEIKAGVIRLPLQPGVTLEEFTIFTKMLSKTHYISVYEKGNPFLHLLAIDKGDGSSYEIIATSSMARIIPRGTETGVDSLYLILDAFSNITPVSKIEYED